MSEKQDSPADRVRKQIKHQLVDLDMSQGDLAKAANLDPGTVSRLLSRNSSADPQLSTLIALAEAIECELIVSKKAQRPVSVEQPHTQPPPKHKVDPPNHEKVEKKRRKDDR